MLRQLLYVMKSSTSDDEGACKTAAVRTEAESEHNVVETTSEEEAMWLDTLVVAVSHDHVHGHGNISAGRSYVTSSAAAVVELVEVAGEAEPM